MSSAVPESITGFFDSLSLNAGAFDWLKEKLKTNSSRMLARLALAGPLRQGSGVLLLCALAHPLSLAGQLRPEHCLSDDYMRRTTTDCPAAEAVRAAAALTRSVRFYRDAYDFHIALTDHTFKHPELDTPAFRDLAMGHAVVAALQQQRGDMALGLAAGAPPNARLVVESGSGSFLLASAPVRTHWSLLLFAAEAGQPLLVEELLRSGANVNEVDEQGRGALIVTAQAMAKTPAGYERYSRILLRLLTAGADPYQEDSEGLSFFGYLTLLPSPRQPLLDELLARGDRLLGRGGSRLLYSLVYANLHDKAARALELGAKPDLWADSKGRTALAIAALRSSPGSIPLIKELVKSGARIDAEDERGRTPLFHAVDSDKRFSGEGALDAEVVTTLLALGAKKNHLDRRGKRAADHAAEPLRSLVQ